MVDLHANMGKASIKAEGNLSRLSAEMMLLVDRFYYELKERDEDRAAVFRYCMKAWSEGELDD